MLQLNWDAFEQLSGDPTRNWELLCRESVRRNYARFGEFRSVAQQAGVEFSLSLITDCHLGATSQHWGWQCRWYSLDAGRQIGRTRRDKIVAAIRTTEMHYPTITDWVLWTRRRLTPSDQGWYYGLSSKFKLHLWAEEELTGLLVGEAEILRSSYFGELVLTQEKLHAMHAEAIAPIEKRWVPQLHVEVEVERSLKAALGRPGTWSELSQASARTKRRVLLIESDMVGLTGNERILVQQVKGVLAEQSQHLV